MRTARAAVPALAVALALFGRASIVVAEPVQTGHVTAELVAEQDALVPGTTATVALRLAIEPGWHTYWRNPGDSGLPTTLDWRLPQGYAAGAIAWPAPRALPAGPLVNYGYEGEVLHLVPLTVPRGRAGRNARDARRTRRLARLQGNVHTRGRRHQADAAGGGTRAGRQPLGVANRGHARCAAARGTGGVECAGDGVRRDDRAAGRRGRRSRSGALRSSPIANGRSSRPHRNTVAQRDGRIDLTLPVAHELAPGFSRLQGVLTADPGFRVDGRVVDAVALDVAVTGTPAAGPKPATGRYCDGFLGVDVRGRAVVAARARIRARRRTAAEPDALRFPGAVAEGAGTGRLGRARRVAMRREGVAFAAGVIVAFVLLGAAIVGLRAAGEQLGLGLPAAISGGRQRAGAAVLRDGTEPVGRVRVRLAAAIQCSRRGRIRIAVRTHSRRACSPSRSRRPARRRSWALRWAMRWRRTRT